MVGETLEKHCSNLFNTMLRPIMENAYFEKDNDVSDGTKGDFIFRDYDSGTEYVSIMFEMKNETDTHSTKHKNEDFLKNWMKTDVKRIVNLLYWCHSLNQIVNCIIMALLMFHIIMKKCM